MYRKADKHLKNLTIKYKIMKKLFPFVLLATITFSGCSKNDAVTDNAATTTAPLAPGFSIDNQNTAKEGAAIQFRNTSAGAVSYKWDFGNGHTSKDQEPVYKYPVCGIYQIKLSAFDAAGNEKVTTKELIVDCIFTSTGNPSTHAPLF
jgi:PKD repeat protein